MKRNVLGSFLAAATLVACGDVPTTSQDAQTRHDVRLSALSQTVDALDFQANADVSYDIEDFGQELQTNKNYLVQVLQGQGASLDQQVLVVAMAMQETNHMDPSERDASKDGTPSANISILNLNIDLLEQAGYSGTDNGAAMNDPKMLGEPVWYLLHAVDMWGLASTLNFQRGGRTAFEDGVSYGAPDYRRSIATIYQTIANDMTLLTDSRRVVIDLEHVF